ncbi:perlucin-like protein [Mugil cephalus]|uniref:perlucin-like protein n=1 Tax=Mugil cephalus TaxID=48193 RepID=UPI001FB5DC8D|nr:perlucin-like protein [Mugil cephalus]
MTCIKNKGSLGIRGHTIFFVLLGLLVSEISSQAAEGPEGELSILKLKLNTVMNHYKLLCDKYSDLALNCSVPVINCTRCPPGWLQVLDRCLFFSSDKLDWLASKEKCKEIGGHLAILTTKEQHEAVEKEGRRIGQFYTDYWIGLSDIETEGDWRWVDNSTLQTPFWNTEKSEPDNNKSGGEDGEDCVVVDSYNQIWYDVPCSFLYPRICQMDVFPLQ